VAKWSNVAFGFGLAAVMVSLPSLAQTSPHHLPPTNATLSLPHLAHTHLNQTYSQAKQAGMSWSFKHASSVGQHTTVRFDQRWQGLPVWGGTTAVRVSNQGKVEWARAEQPEVVSKSAEPLVSKEQVVAAVHQRYPQTQQVQLNPELGWKPLPGRGWLLTWKVTLDWGINARELLIDATDGIWLRDLPVTQQVLGRVYPISKSVTPETKDVELVDIDLQTPQMLNGWLGQFSVANYVSQGKDDPFPVIEQKVVSNSGQDFLYDPPEYSSSKTDEFAQVNAFYHLTRIRDYYRDTIGLDMSSASWKLLAVTNYLDHDSPMSNAFFSQVGIQSGELQAPNLIALGQSVNEDMAYDSDIYIHEFTHYVSHNAIGANQSPFSVGNVGYSPFVSAIDEGVADYFACSLNGDPRLAETFGVLRDLSDTHKVCPNDMNGEVHADGEIIGSFCWSIREKLGVTLTDKLVWGAFSSLSSKSSFQDFSNGILMTADDLIAVGEMSGDQKVEIETMMAARGLNDCDRLLEINGKDRETYLIGMNYLGQTLGTNCYGAQSYFGSINSTFQFTYTPKPEETKMTLRVELDNVGGPGGLDWNLYIRRGKPISFLQSGTGYEVSRSDFELTHIHDDTMVVTLDSDSTPEFKTDYPYYIVITYSHCPLTIAKIQANPVLTEEDPSSSNTPKEPSLTAPAIAGNNQNSGSNSQPSPLPNLQANQSEGGCAVKTASESSQPWHAWLLSLAGLVWLRRKRNRS
jgi:MYXO-CTERM domain-containing protein